MIQAGNKLAEYHLLLLEMAPQSEFYLMTKDMLCTGIERYLFLLF